MRSLCSTEDSAAREVPGAEFGLPLCTEGLVGVFTEGAEGRVPVEGVTSAKLVFGPLTMSVLPPSLYLLALNTMNST